MGSKALLLFGLFVVLLVASEVSARDLAESSTEKSNEVVEKAQHPEQYGGGHYGGGNYGGGHYGGGGNGHYGGRGHYGGGGGCRYGCCHKGYHGCSKCCSYAGEAVETQLEKETGH